SGAGTKPSCPATGTTARRVSLLSWENLSSSVLSMILAMGGHLNLVGFQGRTCFGPADLRAVRAKGKTSLRLVFRDAAEVVVLVHALVKLQIHHGLGVELLPTAVAVVAINAVAVLQCEFVGVHYLSSSLIIDRIRFCCVS